MPVYFAFGSNMDAAQMARRCPGARPLQQATLLSHRLVFRGPSRNRGGGVASVDPTDHQEVRGLLWEVTDEDLRTLDRLEGAPQWYKRASVVVSLDDGATREAILYRLPEHVLEMIPTDAYYDQIAAACATLGLDSGPLEDARRRAEQAESQRSGRE